MPEITFTLSDNGQSARLDVEDSKIINKLYPKMKNNTITAADFGKLKSVAALSGNIDKLEYCDVDGAVNSLKSAALTGNAGYSDGIGNYVAQFFGMLVGDGAVFGDEITLRVPDKNKTLGQLEKEYRLPDGALEHNYTSNKSNYKNDICNGHIYFLARDYAKGNNMSIEDVKKMFGQ